jgi:hypothetical protein
MHFSERLQREVYVDEMGDLTDTELQQLTVEADMQISDLREDHTALPENDVARHHVRHKIGIIRAYRQAARIEQEVRNQERTDKLAILREALIEKIGASETAALFKAAGL